MADTNFTAKVTTIVAVWLNIINNWGYYGRRPNYTTTTGSFNAQILTLETGSLYIAGSEADGDSFVFTAGFTNNAAMTIQVKPTGGANVARAVQLGGVALTGGEVISGRTYQVTRLGATWQLTSLAGTAFSLAALQLQTAAAWRTALGVIASPLTTKGDLWGFSTVDARLPIGTDFQQTRSDSTQALGIKWDWPAVSVGEGYNIAARTNSVTPNTKFDITATALVVKDTNGGAMALNTVSVTIDMSTVGANGIDAGTQVLSTWYYGYVIAKPDGTVAGLASLSATAPTLPNGYTFKALITAVRSDASVHFIPYRQVGNRIFYETAQNVLSAGSASTETAITITAAVPPNALDFEAAVYGTGDVGAGGVANSSVILRAVSAKNMITTSFRGATNGVFGFGTGGFLPNISQTLLYLFTPTTNVAAISINVDVVGFKLPGGGE